MREDSRYTGARLILTQDCALSLLASLLSILLVRWLSEPIPGFTFLVAKWLVAALVGSLIGLITSGSWKMVRRFFTVRSSAKALFAIAIKEVVMTLVLLVGIVKLPSVSMCLIAIMSDLILTGMFLLYIRVASRLLTPASKEVVKERSSKKNVLVAGTDTESVKMAEQIEEEGIYNVAGLVTNNPSIAGRVIADHMVFYCDSFHNLEQLNWKVGGVDAVFFPRNISSTDTDKEPSAGQSEIPHSDGMTYLGLAVKRGFDLTLSGVLLVVFSPLLAICAIAVKKEDGGPVFFKQERIGRDGQPFTIYKLRSMRIDAEAEGTPALYQGDEDERLTRTGRFLRNHHLDELPQLYNVFKGDMSFIGHRPERKYYIDKIMAYDPRYRFLYQIRPGVTSYATLYNGYTDTLDKMLTRLDLDLYYLRNRSVWFDFKVLGLTFLSIVTGKRF